MSILPLLFGGGGVVLAGVPDTADGLPWSVDLCRNWVRIGIVDAFQATAVERFNGPGEWTLSAPVEAVEFGSRLVGGVPRRWKPRNVDTVRFVRGGRVEFAGYVTPGPSGTGGMERTFSADGDRVTWSGPDAWEVLERRLAWPTPALAPGEWTDGHDVRFGQASTVLASFLMHNIGKEARTFRVWPGIVIADHGVGDEGEWSARLQTLSALASRIATDANIRCRVRALFSGSIRVDIDAPADRSAQLTLSDQGDLVSVSTRRTGRTASMVIAGGQGDLAERLFVTANGTFNVLDARHEVFSDQSSLTTAAELQASADATLAGADASWSVSAEASDEASLMLATIARDATVGDLIGLNVDGERHVVPITARRIELSAERRVIVPVLGTAAPDELSTLQRDVAGLAGRLNTSIS
jgi:hypothetical protein